MYESDKKPLELSTLDTLADDDVVIVGDTSDTNEVVKSFTWANLKTALNTFFSTIYATLAQGLLAESAVQPGDNISTLTNDAGFITADDQTASQVPFTPAGTLAATNVQAALEELDADIQNLAVGVAVESPAGTVDGSNATFTVSEVPLWIVSDGIMYFDGAGYSIAALTVTMTVPPSSFIRAVIQ